MTMQEIREIVDAVDTIEEVTGEKLLPVDVGDVLALLMVEGGNDAVSIACARIAIALGDDRPEHVAMVSGGESAE
jgi:hypothetical protein